MSQFGEIIYDEAFLQSIYTSFYTNIFARFSIDFHDFYQIYLQKFSENSDSWRLLQK